MCRNQGNVDVRVYKTKKALWHAFMELLKKRPFSKISVHDICGQALVSRSTFYAHFEDKYQLAVYGFQQLKNHKQPALEEYGFRQKLLDIFSTMEQYQHVLRNLLCDGANKELLIAFHELFYNDYLEFLKYGQELAPYSSVELLAMTYSQGLSGIIIWWLDKNCPCSVQQLTDSQMELLGRLPVLSQPT